MGQPISSAEPEKLFRYSDFGVQLDHDLTVEAARLAATLQHFEATCTEPGFQVGVGHLGDALRGHAGESESVDGWVRQVGKGFQMADWVWSGTVPRPGTVARTAWPLPGWATTTISILTLLPLVSIPGWLARLTLSLPWLRSSPGSRLPEPVQVGDFPRSARSGFGRLLEEPGAPAKKSGFGRLLEEREAETGSGQPAVQAPSTQPPTTQPQPVLDSDRWWHDVPVQSQQGLKYGKSATAYGCTPTATNMILDYWHARDPANKTMSAQELLDKNVEQRKFDSTGMSATHILDEVSNLGYGVAKDHPNSKDFDALKEAVAQGPVIAIVKLGMKTTGTNHAVVVTGISPDGKQVRVNDPWDGKSHTYSRDEFSASWGADFGKDAPKNNFVEIRPS